MRALLAVVSLGEEAAEGSWTAAARCSAAPWERHVTVSPEGEARTHGAGRCSNDIYRRLASGGGRDDDIYRF